MHGTVEYKFNYFHLSLQISIQCTFREFDMHWGILWKSLTFSMKNNTQMIKACLRLHNFIVDYPEEHKATKSM